MITLLYITLLYFHLSMLYIWFFQIENLASCTVEFNLLYCLYSNSSIVIDDIAGYIYCVILKTMWSWHTRFYMYRYFLSTMQPYSIYLLITILSFYTCLVQPIIKLLFICFHIIQSVLNIEQNNKDSLQSFNLRSVWVII